MNSQRKRKSQECGGNSWLREVEQESVGVFVFSKSSNFFVVTHECGANKIFSRLHVIDTFPS